MPTDAFEEAVNEVSDTDWTWWPFLWLRPQKSEPFTLLRVLAIAILYGAPCSGMTAMLLRSGSAEAQRYLPSALVAYPLAFLFLGSVVIAPMWNRRAARERKKLAGGLAAFGKHGKHGKHEEQPVPVRTDAE